MNNADPVSFEDLHELPEPGQSRPKPEGPTVMFDEPCPKCRGSGSYGRVSSLGHSQCTKCKGSGRLTFRTSPEYRAKGRARAAKRKAADTAKAEIAASKRWKVWRDDHEVIDQWFKDNGSDFSQSLWNGGLKYGSLTEAQCAAVYKWIARDDDRKEAEKIPAAKVNLDGLLRAFGTAFDSGLKRPALIIGTLRFSRAPDNGNNPGFLYVKSEGEYVGKINPAGDFLKGYKCTDADVATIAELGDDVLAKAVEHGRRTGNCACCGRLLTAAESVERGIGPICADRWGL